MSEAANSRLFFLSFLFSLSLPLLFFLFFTMRAITIIAFTHSRARARVSRRVEYRTFESWKLFEERRKESATRGTARKGREAAISRLARGAISTTANRGNSAGYSSRYKGITVTVITRPVLLIYFRPILIQLNSRI